MLHFSSFKVAVVSLVCLLGALFAVPNFFDKATVEGWPSFLPQRQIPLGLDLRGGAHLLLEMDTNKLRADWLGTLRDDARKELREARIPYGAIGQIGQSVQVRLVNKDDAGKAMTKLRGLAQSVGNAIVGSGGVDLDVSQTADGAIVISPTEQGLNQRVLQAQTGAIETLNRRVNALGTAESTIVPHGRDRILIQYPGLQDTTQLKNLIGQTAQLSFHEVHPQMTPEQARLTRAPAGFKVFPGVPGERPELLRVTPVVEGQDLVEAQPQFDQQNNQWVISFRFNQLGARKFGAYTRDNVGRRFAILLDDKVLSAPVIREAILGGAGQISGSFTSESAGNLAIALRSGALPAKLTIIEERTVGPSLGRDSIEAGKLAALIGGIATVALTIFVYGTFGIFAVIGLITNGLLLVGIMSLLGSTLTLPGIAGLVLTIGMAVDANVLIFERIREELRGGRSPINAIDAGYSRAIVSIIDSQLTTLTAAIIMFWLGAGPIRGFAVTLSIGIFTSIFTAISVTRMLVALWVRSERRSKRTIEVPI